MENEFDYMNIPENKPEHQPTPEEPEVEIVLYDEEPVPAPQQPEAEPYAYSYEPQLAEPPVMPQPAESYGSYSYNYTQAPASEPKPTESKKKNGKGALIAISIIAGVMLLMNAVLLLTNASLNSSINEQINRNNTLSNQMAAMQAQLNRIEENSQNATIVTPGQAATDSTWMTPQQVYAQNVRAVVAVASEGVTTNIYGQISKTASTGSGFIISADGYVVTNYHVIEGGSQFSVITYDEVEHKATVIGFDKTNDVALLKLEGTDFHYVTIGDSDAMLVGDQVMAIGNPLGELTSTLTVGYISAKDRMVSTDGTAINMMQTDAAINSGNSGGPLFNAKGEVIGINTAKYSGTSSSGATIEGIGFAIPMADVIGIIEDLQNKGYVSSAYLGVMVREVESSAQSYGLPAGVYVEEVTPGYCAEKAGLQAQDIIIGLGEYEVDSMSALTRALRRYEAGTTTTITVYRSGQELTMEITLDEKPVEQQTVTTEPEQQETTPNNGGGYSYPDIWDYFFGG